MTNNKANSKRIAKNTILLYFRLILTMGIGLFTSRIILDTLGVEDYGIYNVVGGFVTMFSFFTSSLSSAISRFLTFSLGKNDLERLKTVFATSVNIQVGISIFIFTVAEIGGIWFLNNQLNIPADRLQAANWVFQCAILAFIINLISVPYNAAIIAHEKMSAFAYISILEVCLKLVIVYLLYISPHDKLQTYSVLFTLVALIIRLVYGRYCSTHFKECRYKFVFDKSLLKEMSGFAGWNLIGSGAYLFNTQGVNIAINIFFGVTLNAARGVANQVEGIVKQFVTNFTTAINPQIIKSYAEGNLDYMFTLICRGAKYSYFLMLFFTVPLIFEAEIIMKIWLKDVPNYAPIFLKLSMAGTLMDVLGNSTANAVWATGHLKRYYIIVGSIGCLVFPITYLCYTAGMPPHTTYLVFFIIYAILVLVKVYIVKWQLNFPVIRFYKEVLLRIAVVTVFSFLIPLILYINMEESIIRFISISTASLCSTILAIYAAGLEKSERLLITTKITRIVSQKLNIQKK